MKTLNTILLLILSTSLMAQTSAEIQYAAYMKLSKSMWERSVSIAEKTSGQESFQKALAMYGLLNSTMATEDEDTFDEHVDSTKDLLKKIIEENPEWGEPKAVLSSVYGLVMAYSPMKGMLYGSKSSSLIEDAIRLQPESPLVQKLYGGSKLYTPTAFGGSPEKAVTAMEESIRIYEEQGLVDENWLYLDALAGLSLAYKKTEQVDSAKKTIEKALEIEPEYGWAKSILASLNK